MLAAVLLCSSANGAMMRTSGLMFGRLQTRCSSAIMGCLPAAMHAQCLKCCCIMQQALKLCNSTLSKFPGNHLVRVLKAVALQRTGRGDDAVQVGEA